MAFHIFGADTIVLAATVEGLGARPVSGRMARMRKRREIASRMYLASGAGADSVQTMKLDVLDGSRCREDKR